MHDVEVSSRPGTVGALSSVCCCRRPLPSSVGSPLHPSPSPVFVGKGSLQWLRETVDLNRRKIRWTFKQTMRSVPNFLEFVHFSPLLQGPRGGKEENVGHLCPPAYSSQDGSFSFIPSNHAPPRSARCCPARGTCIPCICKRLRLPLRVVRLLGPDRCPSDKREAPGRVSARARHAVQWQVPALLGARMRFVRLWLHHRVCKLRGKWRER